MESVHAQRLLEVVARKSGAVCVLFEAYFDESGDDGGFPIMVVGGYLISPGAARKMERKWQAVLSDFGVPYFHMVDCAHEPPSGVLSNIEKPKRIELQTALIDLICENVECGVACATPLDCYQHEADAYSQAVHSVALAITSLLDWKGVSPEKYKLSLFYESGHKNGGKAYEYLKSKSTRFPEFSFSFIDKKDSGIVQAADILVWQYSKFIKDKVLSDRKTRKDFRSLMRMRTVFYNVAPIGGTTVIKPFYNDSLDSCVDEAHLIELFRPGQSKKDIERWAKTVGFVLN